MKKSELTKIIREEYQKSLKTHKRINESDLTSVKVPGNIGSYLDKFIAVMEKVNTTPAQKLTILYQIIKGLGIDPEQFSTMYQKLKTQMNSMPLENVNKSSAKKKKLTESEITKAFDKTVSTYQDMLKQKQDMIQAMKDALSKEKDVTKKQALIKKHNDTMKVLNNKLSVAERKFNAAFTNLEDANEDDLL
jgi:hypothetical protein